MDNSLDPESPDWRRPPVTGEQVYADSALALALFLGAVLSMFLVRMTWADETLWAGTQVSLLALGCVTLPLALRRVFPCYVAIAVSCAFGFVGILPVPEGVMSSIALFIALYSVGAWEWRRTVATWVRLLIILGMFVWLTVSLFRLSTDPETLDDLPLETAGWALSPMVAYALLQILTNVLYFAGAYWFGDKAWTSAQTRAQLEQVATQLAATQRHNEQQAVSLERMRIARELHDAVAHHLAVIGVQAAVARLSDGTRESNLLEIEEASREAVSELRTIVHTLREDSPDESEVAVASLTLEAIPALVAQAKQSGLDITYETVGMPFAIPPLMSLHIYRIAQESLTNIVRHAGTRVQVTLTVRFDPQSVEIEVANTSPPGPRRRFAGAGVGIIGMRERVDSYNGSFTAAPLSRGGFVVHAAFPLTMENAS